MIIVYYITHKHILLLGTYVILTRTEDYVCKFKRHSVIRKQSHFADDKI